MGRGARGKEGGSAPVDDDAEGEDVVDLLRADGGLVERRPQSLGPHGDAQAQVAPLPSVPEKHDARSLEGAAHLTLVAVGDAAPLGEEPVGGGRHEREQHVIRVGRPRQAPTQGAEQQTVCADGRLARIQAGIGLRLLRAAGREVGGAVRVAARPPGCRAARGGGREPTFLSGGETSGHACALLSRICALPLPLLLRPALVAPGLRIVEPWNACAASTSIASTI